MLDLGLNNRAQNSPNVPIIGNTKWKCEELRWGSCLRLCNASFIKWKKNGCLKNTVSLICSHSKFQGCDPKCERSAILRSVFADWRVHAAPLCYEWWSLGVAWQSCEHTRKVEQNQQENWKLTIGTCLALQTMLQENRIPKPEQCSIYRQTLLYLRSQSERKIPDTPITILIVHPPCHPCPLNQGKSESFASKLHIITINYGGDRSTWSRNESWRTISSWAADSVFTIDILE